MVPKVILIDKGILHLWSVSPAVHYSRVYMARRKDYRHAESAIVGYE
jgi:hypothetical protein